MGRTNHWQYVDKREGIKFEVITNHVNDVYLRVENKLEQYLGSLDGRALKDLTRRLSKVQEELRHAKNYGRSR